MPRGHPGNPYIHKDPLREATLAVQASIRNLVGFTPNPKQAERVAERCIRAYLTTRGENNFGNRMKPSTLQIYEMEVGDVIEVEATGKHVLHGQFKTVRMKTGIEDLKWKCEEISPGRWRVERRPNGSWNRGKNPLNTPKAVFLAGIPPGETRFYEGATDAFQLISGYLKNKAREILGNQDVDWRAKRVVGKGYNVTRIR